MQIKGTQKSIAYWTGLAKRFNSQMAGAPVSQIGIHFDATGDELVLVSEGPKGSVRVQVPTTDIEIVGAGEMYVRGSLFTDLLNTIDASRDVVITLDGKRVNMEAGTLHQDFPVISTEGQDHATPTAPVLPKDMITVHSTTFAHAVGIGGSAADGDPMSIVLHAVHIAVDGDDGTASVLSVRKQESVRVVMDVGASGESITLVPPTSVMNGDVLPLAEGFAKLSFGQDPENTKVTVFSMLDDDDPTIERIRLRITQAVETDDFPIDKVASQLAGLEAKMVRSLKLDRADLAQAIRTASQVSSLDTSHQRRAVAMNIEDEVVKINVAGDLNYDDELEIVERSDAEPMGFQVLPALMLTALSTYPAADTHVHMKFTEDASKMTFLKADTLVDGVKEFSRMFAQPSASAD